MDLFKSFLENKREERKEKSNELKYMLCGIAHQNGVCTHICASCAFKVKDKEDQ